jgi:hypothetical protein
MSVNQSLSLEVCIVEVVLVIHSNEILYYSLLMRIYYYRSVFIFYCVNVLSLYITDFGFDVVLSICYFSLIFEWITTTGMRSTITSLYPLKRTGFVFTFFWWCDVVAIVLYLPTIQWLSMQGDALANYRSQVYDGR